MNILSLLHFTCDINTHYRKVCVWIIKLVKIFVRSSQHDENNEERFYISQYIMCNINLSVLLSSSPDQGRLGPNPLLRAYIIPSSGHWTNLSILTFWHVAPSGGQKTHSAALRATEPALFTVTLKTPLDYLLFFLKNFTSTVWFGSAAWPGSLRGFI